jgi:uncharacterized protein (TIGR02757 family)
MTFRDDRLLCLKPALEKVYRNYNRREFVHPDPLEFLYSYEKTGDREIAGFIASALAYGRVAQILKSVSKALSPLGKSPGEFLPEVTEAFLDEFYGDFKHRFTTAEELKGLVRGLRETIIFYGSLEEALSDHIYKTGSLLSGLDNLISTIGEWGRTPVSSLLVRPSGKSACKRLFLFLKWMVRYDDVDPGGWTCVLPKELYMPVDTHILNISRKLVITKRKNADLKTAMEITNAFSVIAPEDPLKYDFSLTRFGIRSDMTVDDLVDQCLLSQGSKVSEKLVKSNK